MSSKAILVIDGKEFVMLTFSYSFKQGENNTEKQSQRPVFNGLVAVVEIQNDASFYDWMLTSTLDKEVKIFLISKRLGSHTRILSFFNAHLVHLKVNYLANSKIPASITLRINARGFEDSFSLGVYAASW